jgi:LAO/AO transport system kinase
MWALVQERLHDKLTSDPAVRGRVPAIERALAEGTLSPTAGADEIVRLLGISG